MSHSGLAREQKDFKEENLEEYIREVKMAKKKKPDCRTKEGKKSSQCKRKDSPKTKSIKGYAKAKRGLSKLKKSRP